MLAEINTDKVIEIAISTYIDAIKYEKAGSHLISSEDTLASLKEIDKKCGTNIAELAVKRAAEMFHE